MCVEGGDILSTLTTHTRSCRLIVLSHQGAELPSRYQRIAKVSSCCYTNQAASLQGRRGVPSRGAAVRIMARGSITGKTVVITGASQGIGLEFARQFLGKRNHVIAGVRNPEDAQELSKLGDGAVKILHLEVTSAESIAAWAEAVRGTTDHVDVLINNAGVLMYSGFESVTAEELLECFRVNAIGPLLIAQQLHERGLIGGELSTLIGNITSKVGSNDDNGSGGGYAYRASKAALNIINTSMSIDLKDEGVSSVLLHPGWVRTRMTGGSGLIDVQQSAAGLIGVLESDLPLNGRWYDYTMKSIPW